MALMGKFPDYFAAAYGASGMSDYAEWYRMVSWWATRAGDISMHTVMGASPDEIPEAYASRGGLTTVENLLHRLHQDLVEPPAQRADRLPVPVGIVTAAFQQRPEPAHVPKELQGRGRGVREDLLAGHGEHNDDVQTDEVLQENGSVVRQCRLDGLGGDGAAAQKRRALGILRAR